MELSLFIFDQIIDIKSRVQSIGIYIWRKRKLNEEIFFHVRINVHFTFELKFTTLNKNNFYTIWNREREKFFPISQITNNILFRIRIQHRNTFSIFIYTIKIHHPEWKYDFHDIYGRRKLDEEIPYSYKRALPFSFAHNSKFARISTCVSSFPPISDNLSLRAGLCYTNNERGAFHTRFVAHRRRVELAGRRLERTTRARRMRVGIPADRDEAFAHLPRWRKRNCSRFVVLRAYSGSFDWFGAIYSIVSTRISRK